jgi:hypothetical protein
LDQKQLSELDFWNIGLSSNDASFGCMSVSICLKKFAKLALPDSDDEEWSKHAFDTDNSYTGNVTCGRKLLLIFSFVGLSNLFILRFN